jgi:hypothetical protein
MPELTLEHVGSTSSQGLVPSQFLTSQLRTRSADETRQTLYLLTYQGEGFTKAWFNGRVYEDVDATDFSNGVCDVAPSRCTGKTIEASRTEWWVQVRNAAGKMGWTREPDKFDGKDDLS